MQEVPVTGKQTYSSGIFALQRGSELYKNSFIQLAQNFLGLTVSGFIARSPECAWNLNRCEFASNPHSLRFGRFFFLDFSYHFRFLSEFYAWIMFEIGGLKHCFKSFFGKVAYSRPLFQTIVS
jgi:hypothetical protein